MDAPFVWGSDGSALTPEQIAARRKAADALMAQGMDASPIRSWTQGAARVAQGVMGALDSRNADNSERANADANKQLIASLLSGSGATTATPAASVSSSPVVGSAAPSIDTSGKIYSNDEPSPLDPPSGQDRQNMIATILGEESTPDGRAGVANVIRNRAVDGGYGGNTPTAVVQSPNQFEPWNTDAGRQRMASAAANPQQAAAADAAIKSAYGEGGRAPEDPTEGKTMFYAPAAQAALGRAAPSWAQGPGQMLGKTAFFDDNDPSPAKPVQVASNDPTAIPVNAAPAQGVLPTAEAVAGQTPVAKVAGALSGVNPNVIAALTSPNASPQTKQIAGIMLQAQLSKEKKDTFSPGTDAEGNQFDINNTTHERKMFAAAEKSTGAQKDFEYGQTHPEFVKQQLERTKAGAAQLNNQNNIDMNSGQTYDKQLAEGLGKSHAALANGVEDAQTRARDVAAMQGAVDAIQKNGGTTGGLAPQARLELQKSINAGAAAVGIDKPFNESDLSDKEFLTKFNRSMAGAQAKNAVGSRVTNFEMSNFLKANPGLDMTITGNQRLLGIQGQIEQRNIAVGNAIRGATAEAISKGQKIDPVTVQKIITDYDEQHHIKDATTGQDLTQSYALPEFQNSGTNPALAAQHETNVGRIRRYNPTTGALE